MALTFVALKTPPATFQLAAVAVAFRDETELPLITSPGLTDVPSVRASVLLPVKMSVAVPNTEKRSTVLVAFAEA